VASGPRPRGRGPDCRPLREVLAAGEAIVRITTPDREEAARLLHRLQLAGIGQDQQTGSVTARLGDLAPEEISAALVHAGVRLTGFAVERPHLEELFVSITGEGFDVLP